MDTEEVTNADLIAAAVETVGKKGEVEILTNLPITITIIIKTHGNNEINMSNKIHFKRSQDVTVENQQCRLLPKAGVILAVGVPAAMTTRDTFSDQSMILLMDDVRSILIIDFLFIQLICTCYWLYRHDSVWNGQRYLWQSLQMRRQQTSRYCSCQSSSCST